MVPGMSGCPVIPMGGIPKLFMAVAQALGSDIGIVIGLESIVMLQMPSAGKNKHTQEVGECHVCELLCCCAFFITACAHLHKADELCKERSTEHQANF